MGDETSDDLSLGPAGTSSSAGGQRIPVGRERVVLGKREVERVTAQVGLRTHSDDVTISEPLRAERIEVERVPVDRYVETPPLVRTEGDVTIVPVVEEVLVVETRLVLVEEIHIRRVAQRERVEQSVTLRRQHAVVERLDPETGEILNATTLTSED